MSTSGTLTPVNTFSASTPQVQSGSTVLSADANSQAQVFENRTTYLRDQTTTSTNHDTGGNWDTWTTATFANGAGNHIGVVFPDCKVGDIIMLWLHGYMTSGEAGTTEFRLKATQNALVSPSVSFVAGFGQIYTGVQSTGIAYCGAFTVTVAGQTNFDLQAMSTSAASVAIGNKAVFMGNRRRP